jgi:hypothetical protein
MARARLALCRQLIPGAMTALGRPGTPGAELGRMVEHSGRDVAHARMGHVQDNAGKTARRGEPSGGPRRPFPAGADRGERANA